MYVKVGALSNFILVQIRTVEVGLPTSMVNAEAFVPGTDFIWSIGWTDPTQRVTGWSVWLQRMRGALLKLPIAESGFGG
ncbi:hypothetical protein [Brucella sp. BO2]|uniref:hypothetical protein n=1 Tax=Brucella sp. BO2 TaxID=693750 RepID=UPI00046CF611|nr:hypothetical protein [Brucella sp. BO2]